MKIFVGRIPEGSEDDELRKLFEDHGDVSECAIISKFGFVHMPKRSDALAAIKALHQSRFNGGTINVEESSDDGSGRRGRRGGRGRGEYEGDRDRRGGGGYEGGRDRRGRGRGESGGYGGRYPPPPPPRGRDPYFDDMYERPMPPRGRDPYDDEPFYQVRDPYGHPPPPGFDYSKYLTERERLEKGPAARYPSASEGAGHPSADPYAKVRDPYAAPPAKSSMPDPYASRDSYISPQPRAAVKPAAYDPYSTASSGLYPARSDPYSASSQYAQSGPMRAKPAPTAYPASTNGSRYNPY